jgi:hypothetical protein
LADLDEFDNAKCAKHENLISMWKLSDKFASMMVVLIIEILD